MNLNEYFQESLDDYTLQFIAETPAEVLKVLKKPKSKNPYLSLPTDLIIRTC